MAIASRLLLTLTEVGAAGPVLLAGPPVDCACYPLLVLPD